MDLFAISLAKRHKVGVLPWETPLMEAVMGRSKDIHRLADSELWSAKFLASANSVRLEPTSESAFPAHSSSSGSAAHKSVNKAKTGAVDESEEALRFSALKRWKLIIFSGMEFSRTGRQIKTALSRTGGEELADMIISDTFENKAVSTMNARSGSIMQYTEWLSMAYPCMPTFPLDEDYVYQYLCDLRVHKSSATKSQRMREAIAFSFGVIGLDGAEEAMKSQRCLGAAMSVLMTKRVLEQMDPLTAEILTELEKFTFDSEPCPDSAFSGHLCFTAHTRGRWSDFNHCETEPYLDVLEDDSGYIEVEVTGTKTGNSKRRRRRKLPMVGSALGISGFPWARKWLQHRSYFRLNSSGSFLMPAIDSFGQFTGKRLDSHSGSIWMRRLIMKLVGIQSLDGRKTATHSLKTTVLSMAAKF